jgi:hypothetical protein
MRITHKRTETAVPAARAEPFVRPETLIAEGDGVITRFADPEWNVAPLIGATSIPSGNKVVRFDFDVTPGQRGSAVADQSLIQVAKELAFARLLFYPWQGVNPRIVTGFQKHRGEENKTPVIPDDILAVMGKHAIRYKRKHCMKLPGHAEPLSGYKRKAGRYPGREGTRETGQT